MNESAQSIEREKRLLARLISMKPATDNMVEGRTAFDAFRNAMRKIVAVPHSVTVEREALYKLQSDAKLVKRGPKRKKT